MEDENVQSNYSPANSHYSSPAYKTFSAPTSPMPSYANQQPPMFVNANESNFFDYERQSSQPMIYSNFHANSETAQASTPSTAQLTEQVADYYPFYSNNQMDQANKYPINESAPVNYFSCSTNEFNS